MDELKKRMDGIVAALNNVDYFNDAVWDVHCAIDGIDHIDGNIVRDVERLEDITQKLRDAQRAFRECSDESARAKLGYAVGCEIEDLPVTETLDWLRQLGYDMTHQVTPSKTQLPIYEVVDEDGEVGVSIPDGDRTIVSFGWTAQDVYDVLALVTEYDPKEITAFLERM